MLSVLTLDFVFLLSAAEACAGSCGDGLVEVGPEDLVDLQTPSPDRPLRSYSCSSLDSAVDTDPDPEDGGFLRLDVSGEEEEEEGSNEGKDGEFKGCALEESWFITPPPCFTAGGRAPILLETSPLENLLIEHPSMSVYAVNNPRHTSRPLAMESSRETSLHRLFSKFYYISNGAAFMSFNLKKKNYYILLRQHTATTYQKM